MIRKITFDSTDRDGRARCFVYTKEQSVFLGDEAATISSFDYSQRHKELTVYVACDGLEFQWFSLINPTNLKIEWEYGFFKNEDPYQCPDEGGEDLQ